MDDSLSDVSVVMPEHGSTSPGYIKKDYTFKGKLPELTFRKILYSITCVGDPITLDFSRCTGYLTDDIFYGVSSNAKLKKIVLPGCLKKIPNLFADHNDTLKSVVISDGTTEIGSKAFYCCTALESVVIESVTRIRQYAFCGCESLKSVTIPEGVTTIDSLAFGGCTSLESVTISKGVTTIETSAFSGCKSLSKESKTALRAAGYKGNL